MSDVMDGSALDCVECGGYVDIQRADRICQGCKVRMAREHAMYVAAGKELQAFRCAHCGAVEVYDPPEFVLLGWWQASEAFGQQHAGCTP